MNRTEPASPGVTVTLFGSLFARKNRRYRCEICTQSLVKCSISAFKIWCIPGQELTRICFRMMCRNRILYNVHWENYISISFHIECDMIVMTVFLSILNQMELYLVQNWKENCPHDHIPFIVKGNDLYLWFIFIWQGKLFKK